MQTKRFIPLLLLTFFFLSGGYSLAQDTTIYKIIPYEPDTCKNFVGPVFVGCGHPDFGFWLCEGNQLTELSIYDRWGYQLFVTTDPYTKWDFQDPHGSLISQGTYVYRLEFNDSLGNPIIELGKFDIVR